MRELRNFIEKLLARQADHPATCLIRVDGAGLYFAWQGNKAQFSWSSAVGIGSDMPAIAPGNINRDADLGFGLLALPGCQALRSNLGHSGESPGEGATLDQSLLGAMLFNGRLDSIGT